MKIPAPYRQDSPTAAEPIVVPTYNHKLPSTRVRKSDVAAPADYIKPPCDVCHDDSRAPLPILKYNPRAAQWLCPSCYSDSKERASA